jgi:signal transduction histidine kinase
MEAIMSNNAQRQDSTNVAFMPPPASALRILATDDETSFAHESATETNVSTSIARDAHLEALYRACIAHETASYYEHALRNTLNAIGQSTFMLRRHLAREVVPSRDPRVASALAAIETKVRESVDVFGGAPDPCLDDGSNEPFDIHDALDAVLRRVNIPGTTVLEVVPIRLRGRRAALELACACLLENAAESIASTGEGRVVVRVRRFRRGAAVEVHDDGPGLLAAESDAFAHFFTTKAGHLGLGLPIARLLARHVGGAVSLAPSDLGGICARLELFEEPA